MSPGPRCQPPLLLLLAGMPFICSPAAAAHARRPALRLLRARRMSPRRPPFAPPSARLRSFPPLLRLPRPRHTHPPNLSPPFSCVVSFSAVPFCRFSLNSASSALVHGGPCCFPLPTHAASPRLSPHSSLRLSPRNPSHSPPPPLQAGQHAYPSPRRRPLTPRLPRPPGPRRPDSGRAGPQTTGPRLWAAGAGVIKGMGY